MGTKYWEVVCDEHSIGGDREYCGGKDAQLDCTNVLCHGASSGNYAPRAVLVDFELGVIDALRASPLGELFLPGNHVNQNAGAGNNWTMAH
jgi:tubulin beta